MKENIGRKQRFNKHIHKNQHRYQKKHTDFGGQPLFANFSFIQVLLPLVKHEIYSGVLPRNTRTACCQVHENLSFFRGRSQ